MPWDPLGSQGVPRIRIWLVMVGRRRGGLAARATRRPRAGIGPRPAGIRQWLANCARAGFRPLLDSPQGLRLHHQAPQIAGNAVEECGAHAWSPTPS